MKLRVSSGFIGQALAGVGILALAPVLLQAMKAIQLHGRVRNKKHISPILERDMDLAIAIAALIATGLSLWFVLGLQGDLASHLEEAVEDASYLCSLR